MTKGRTIPHCSPRSLTPLQRAAAASARDRGFFRANPHLTTYEREYIPGEWPGFDHDDDDLPFRTTLVSQIGPALHRWFLTETRTFRHGFSDAPNERSMREVQAFIQRFAASERLQASEVQL